MIIEVGNFKCRLHGDIKKIVQIQKAFKVRNPNAYFIRLKGRVQPGWDGKIDYITDANYFKMGLLPKVYDFIKETWPKEKITFEDNRPNFGIKPKVPKVIGDKKPWPYQKEAIEAVINNHVGGLHFPVGVENAATNAGKTLIMAGIYLAYKRKIPALVLINDGDLYEQFKTEIPALVGDDAGFVRSKDKHWNKFTVGMVQTISRNIRLYKHELTKFGMILVDEADQGDSKSYRNILENCYNSNVRVGLSGSIYLSKLAKDKPKNENIRSFFGEEIFKIKNREMVDKGYSTNVIIRIFPGSDKPAIVGEKDWKAEYDRGITFNEDRIQKAIDRVKFNAKMGRLPALVIGQFHNHIELMGKVFENQLGHKYRIAYVHGAVKNRKKIMADFREGKIDILISSFIIKRGKNFPLLKYLLNAAGSDSHSTVLQLMGRLLRKSDTKNKTYMEDFFDEGKYLKRHSKHRVAYYKRENFKVIENYKK